MEIVIVLGLLLVLMVLFALEFVSVDTVTLTALVILVMTGVLTVEEAFQGFSSEIIIILTAIFVISGSLQDTGVIDNAAYLLYKWAGRSLNRLMLILMGITGSISAFMNNTTVAAAFIPVTNEIARRANLSAAKLLIPLAYASILGGTCTLIGTSTNVAVSGYLAQTGMPSIGLFELTPLGIIALAIGILYLTFVGKYLLPDHKVTNIAEILPEYLCEVVVIPESPLTGQSISKSKLADLGFRIVALQRGKRKYLAAGQKRIKQGDILFVQGKPDDLLKIKETSGIEIKPELKFDLEDSQNHSIRIAEALIVPKSYLIGRSIKTADFKRRYGLTALGIYRHGHSLTHKPARVRLRTGDLLLVQGETERLDYLRRNEDFWILEKQAPKFNRKRKGLLTLFFFLAAVMVAGLGWMPLSIALMSASILIILCRCISMEDAYKFIEWKLIIMIGGMSAFGVAMANSGAAQFVSDLTIKLLEPYGVMAILTGLFVLTTLLTQPMSNAAAALVVLPIALHTAQSLGVNERTFAVAIMMAASTSFIAPFEPASILVYGPGKYKFRDFIKVGGPLTLILTFTLLPLIPVFWPFNK